MTDIYRDGSELVRKNIESLSSSLSDLDVAWLRRHYTKGGFDLWLQWHWDNIEEIRKYVTSPPEMRASKKKWCSHARRRLLTFHGVYVMLHAAQFLDAYAILDQFRTKPLKTAHQLLQELWSLSITSSYALVEAWWIDKKSPF